jgi:hypothetical protein
VSPEPYVHGQALVLGVLLVAAAVLGSPIAALAISLATGLAAWGLRVRYRGDVLLARMDVPPHRERLDLIVAGDVRAAVAVGVAASALLMGFDVTRPDVGAAPATSVILAATAAGILLSSLVDWYVILPRVSGLLGARPCRHPDRDHPRFPRTWRETTRWWYIHRIAAALILRFGLSYAIALTVAHHVSLFGGASVVAASVTTLFASYVTASGRAVWEAGHVSMIVGRTVRRRSIERTRRTATVLGRRVPLPLPKRRTLGSWRPRDYVYDVALEAVQVVSASTREGDVPHDEEGRIVYERHPTKVAVRDVTASEPEPAKRPFSGCERECSGINWYCIENPDCFATK